MHIKRVRSKKCEEMIAQSSNTVQIRYMNSIILTMYTAHAWSRVRSAGGATDTGHPVKRPKWEGNTTPLSKQYWRQER